MFIQARQRLIAGKSYHEGVCYRSACYSVMQENEWHHFPSVFFEYADGDTLTKRGRYFYDSRKNYSNPEEALSVAEKTMEKLIPIKSMKELNDILEGWEMFIELEWRNL